MNVYTQNTAISNKIQRSDFKKLVSFVQDLIEVAHKKRLEPRMFLLTFSALKCKRHSSLSQHLSELKHKREMKKKLIYSIIKVCIAVVKKKLYFKNMKFEQEKVT